MCIWQRDAFSLGLNGWVCKGTAVLIPKLQRWKTKEGEEQHSSQYKKMPYSLFLPFFPVNKVNNSNIFNSLNSCFLGRQIILLWVEPRPSDANDGGSFLEKKCRETVSVFIESFYKILFSKGFSILESARLPTCMVLCDEHFRACVSLKNTLLLLKYKKVTIFFSLIFFSK